MTAPLELPGDEGPRPPLGPAPGGERSPAGDLPGDIGAAGAGAPAGPPAAGGRLPRASWPPWTGLAAPFAGIALALLGGLLVEIPAVLAGAHIDAAAPPPGVTLADTAVQDLAFVAAILIFASATASPVYAWQFGLRRPRVGWRRALLAVPAVYLTFLALDVFWSLLLHVTEREKLLETLGANEGTALLLLSAALTCVLAPICEELLFRGYIFRALSNWRGVGPAALLTAVLFGAAHAGSAPVMDLVPLGMLGFLLCLLYRWSGSLYPCIGVHSLNNSIAFGALEGWRWWQVAVLITAAWALAAAVALALRAAHVITDEAPARVPAGAA